MLLLIPAVFFALFPYFRLSKKYRRTRNRVVSIVLHLCVMILCISLLAGISFRYEIPNTKNEVLLLVDSSFSSQEAQQKKDEFIRSAIDEKLDSVKMGIVTFGYNQIYAAELTYDADELFSQYLEAQQPDNSATDVASALEYASRLFSNPETAKIVLISDGAETDRKASTIIKSIAAEGIKVDTVLIPEEERGAETELIGVTYPEEKIIVNQKFSLGITVQSSFEGKAKIVLYDNDEKVGEIAQIDLVEGIQTIEFEHTFTSAGLHKISFSIESDEDTLAENNSFYSYVYLEVFDDMSTLPLDDGARFKTWRETFITKIVIAYGTVFSVNIFVLLLPLITRMRIDEISGFGNSMFVIFMIVGGAMVIPAGQALFCKLFGQADDMHAGGNFLRSAFYGSRMVGAATFGLAHKIIHGGASVGKAISNHRKNKADSSGGGDNSDKYSEDKTSAETTEGSESSGGESTE